MGEKLLRDHYVRFIHSEFAPINIKNVTKIHGASYLRMLQSHGYDVYLEDASHNIFEKTLARLPVRIVYDAPTLAKMLVRGSRPMEQLISAEKVESFVQTLIDDFADVRCCMVNLLAHKPASRMMPSTNKLRYEIS